MPAPGPGFVVASHAPVAFPSNAPPPSVSPPSSSAWPMSYSPDDDDTFAPKRSPWFARGLIVAAAAGALLIVQRNGLFHSFARAVDQEKKLEQLESTVVGSPAVDTPRGLENKLEQIRAQNRLDELSRTDPQAAAAAAAAAKPTSLVERDTAPTEQEKSAAAAESAKPAKQEEVKNAFASALAGKPAPKKAAAPVSSARKTTRAKATGSSRSNRGGNEYDPMNGTL
jgi:hypothetical protein